MGRHTWLSPEAILSISLGSLLAKLGESYVVLGIEPRTPVAERELSPVSISPVKRSSLKFLRFLYSFMYIKNLNYKIIYLLVVIFFNTLMLMMFATSGSHLMNVL